ncbi:hypothetical protein [Paenibacillus agilis]|uniref:DUF948 domain-containing protein n=1 Tax=Paenibacillus agilis TaxID=3020863 RepID=A0A559IXZ7_9BACL|nr:hypothetical protein [Paenibacillus agilis]TVX92512.1 hypothetical protein FPZ44_05250 [Paenibacillus agilis]
MDWIIAIVLLFSVITAAAALLLLDRLMKFMHRTEHMLAELHKESLQLIQQGRLITERGQHLLETVERVSQESAAWSDTSSRIRGSVNHVHEQVDGWITRTMNTLDSAYEAQQHRIHDLLRWVDTAAGLYASVAARRSPPTKPAHTPDEADAAIKQ